MLDNENQAAAQEQNIEAGEQVQDSVVESFATNPEENSVLEGPIAEEQPVETSADEPVVEVEQATTIGVSEESATQVVDEQPTIEASTVSEAISEEVIAENEALTQQSEAVLEEIAEEEVATVDYESYTKGDFTKLLEAQLEIIKGDDVKASDFKRIDTVLKEARVYFDQFKKADRNEAFTQYVAANGSEDGFEYKHDDDTQKFDSTHRQIRDIKNHFFQNLEKSKERNLAVKTQLLQRLRLLIDEEESNKTNAANSWQEFTKIQNEWKEAGNIASPHNGTLWATYHALLDRYYSNRTIYNELKDLDRKKNLSLKTELVEKVEAMAKATENTEVTRESLESVAALFEEYKQIGPANKAEQESLWKRLRAAMDVVYEKRRTQNEGQKVVLAQNYEVKSKIYEALVPYTTYQSPSINEWNVTTKEVVALQDQWVSHKGQMLREEGRELSKKFWATLKVFFNNKGDFFRQLEAKREQNLAQKTQLCEQAEAIVAGGDDSAASTEAIIDLQKQWKQIGQVPEKQKNSIFERFKVACDGYFAKKRAKNQEVEREYADNLTLKETLCANIEAAAKSGAGSIEELNEFKAQWSQAGFVPKKDMQAINKRYIDAVNAYISAVGGMSGKDKSQAKLKNEVAVSSTDSAGGKNLQKRESDVRRKIQGVENEIAQLRNNIEFFARSKGAEKLRADVDKKVAVAEKQLKELKEELKIIREGV